MTRAHALGFTTITARGFDVARAQIQRALLLAKDLCGMSGVNLTFDVADLTAELPEADASVDLTLQSSARHKPVEDLRGGRARYRRALYSHGALGWQHSDYLGRFD